MAFNTGPTKTENYVFGRGVLWLALYDAAGYLMGERDVGNVPGLSVAVTSAIFEHESSRTGIGTVDLSVTTKVTYKVKFEIEDMSAENYALFLAGSSATVTQTATPVTGERIRNVATSVQYQLGLTSSNQAGVRGVTGVTLSLWEAANATARANSTAYVVGDIFKSGTNAFIVSTAGTSAGSAPSFVTSSVGATTTDGTAVVKYLGSTTAYTVDTDYVLSADSSRFYITTTGAIAAAAALLASGSYLSLIAGYTPVANSRTQVSSGSSAGLTAYLHFIADNAEGDNRDLIIPSATLSPSGDNPFITGNAVSKFTVDAGVNQLNSSTAQVIIDGRPV